MSQKQLDLIDSFPLAVQILTAICMFSEKSATVTQIENRLDKELDIILIGLIFLEEHGYIEKDANENYLATARGISKWSESASQKINLDNSLL